MAHSSFDPAIVTSTRLSTAVLVDPAVLPTPDVSRRVLRPRFSRRVLRPRVPVEIVRTPLSATFIPGVMTPAETVEAAKKAAADVLAKEGAQSTRATETARNKNYIEEVERRPTAQDQPQHRKTARRK